MAEQTPQQDESRGVPSPEDERPEPQDPWYQFPGQPTKKIPLDVYNQLESHFSKALKRKHRLLIAKLFENLGKVPEDKFESYFTDMLDYACTYEIEQEKPKKKGRVKRFFKGLGYLFAAGAAAAGALLAGSEIRDYVDSQKHTNKTNRQTFDRLEQRICQLENNFSDSCSTNQNNYSATKTQLESVNARVSGLEDLTRESDSKISTLEAEAKRIREYAASLFTTIVSIEAKDRETRNVVTDLNTQYEKDKQKLRAELAKHYQDAIANAVRIEQEIKRLKEKDSKLQEDMDNMSDAVLENEERLMFLEESKEKAVEQPKKQGGKQ